MVRHYSLFDLPSLGRVFTDPELNNVWKDFDRVFSAFSERIPSFPPYNVYALKDGSVKVQFALAGYEPEDIKLTAEDGKLIVESIKKEDCECPEGECDCEADEIGKEADNGRCMYHGIKSSSFKTVVPIQTRFDLSKTEAKMKNGLLDVTIPLAEERKPKSIKVEIGASEGAKKLPK